MSSSYSTGYINKGINLNEIDSKNETKNEIVDENEIENKDGIEMINGIQTKGEIQAKNGEDEIGVYKRRFWIIGVFSFTAFLQITIWGTFGPILESTQFAFGWSDGYIALLSAWPTIASVIFSLPMGWFISKKGLRFGMLVVVSCILIATGCRCVTRNEIAFKYLASVAAILNGIAGCITLSLPTKVSSTWFPPAERTTATAIAFMAHRTGGMGMYLSAFMVNTPINGTTEEREEIQGEIFNVMYTHFGAAALAFILVVFTFPYAPPKPPSKSSAERRISYKDTLKQLYRNRDAKLGILVVVGLLAVPFPWMTVMNLSLSCIGISQSESVWIAFGITIGCLATAFISARITDKVYGHLKVSLVVILSTAVVFFVWFALLLFEIIESPSHVQIYISIIGALSIQYAAVPLITELVVELAYPCPENVLGSIETFLFDIGSSSFLLLLMIETECYKWVSGVFVIGAAALIIPVLILKENYKRNEVEVKVIS